MQAFISLHPIATLLLSRVKQFWKPLQRERLLFSIKIFYKKQPIAKGHFNFFFLSA